MTQTVHAEAEGFDSIVWATDGTPESNRAQAYVRELCERYDSSLRVVHVADRFPGGTLSEHRVAALKARTSALRRHGINASLHVIRGAIGSPAHQITEVARMSGADLVIVTTHGRSPLVGAITGSVTQRLLTDSPCPVLILPAAAVAPRQTAAHPSALAAAS